MRKLLLACGVLSSLWYVVMNVIVPLQWPDYSSWSRTVSELSAIGSPTRTLWNQLALFYALLLVAFGFGVRRSASHNRALRAVGSLLIADGLIDLAWPPMHQRSVLAAGGGTLTDTLHLVWSGATVLLMLLAIGLGSAAFGKRFRVYSIATAIVLVVCGAVTGLDAPEIGANLPTPWVGMWERINIGAFMLWVIVLAVVLLRTPVAIANAGRRLAA